MMQPISFKSAPMALIFEINSRNIKVSKTLKFEQEGETVVLDVGGLIYHGDFLFTSHIIGTDGITWYHDGMTTGMENCPDSPDRKHSCMEGSKVRELTNPKTEIKWKYTQEL